MAIRRATTDEFTEAEVAAIREMLRAAFEGDPEEEFTDEDWDHAVGGLHFILEEDGTVAAHASVVERELHTSGHRLTTGYVEAVATRPDLQRRGHGSTLMREVGEYIDRTFQLGACAAIPPSTSAWDGWCGKGPPSSGRSQGSSERPRKTATCSCD